MIRALCGVSLTRLCWRFWRRCVKLYLTETIARTCEKGSVVLVISLWCERLRRSNEASYLLSSVRQRTLALRWRRPGTQNPTAPDVQESACTFGVASSQLAWTEGSHEQEGDSFVDTWDFLSSFRSMSFLSYLKVPRQLVWLFQLTETEKNTKNAVCVCGNDRSKADLGPWRWNKDKELQIFVSNFFFCLEIILIFRFWMFVQWFHHRPQAHAWLQLLHIILYIYR